MSKGGADVLVRINRPWHQAFRDIEAVVGPGVAGADVPQGREPRAPGRHRRAARHARGRARPGAGPHAARGADRDRGRLLPRPRDRQGDARASSPSISAPRTSPPRVGMEPRPRPCRPQADHHHRRARRRHPAARLHGHGRQSSTTSTPSAPSSAARASFGFAGASCIHPSQVPILNEEFGWSDAEIDRARRMVAAYDAAKAQGLGAVTFEGKMIDVPVVERAAGPDPSGRAAADATPRLRVACSDRGLSRREHPPTGLFRPLLSRNHRSSHVRDGHLCGAVARPISGSRATNAPQEQDVQEIDHEDPRFRPARPVGARRHRRRPRGAFDAKKFWDEHPTSGER